MPSKQFLEFCNKLDASWARIENARIAQEKTVEAKASFLRLAEVAEDLLDHKGWLDTHQDSPMFEPVLAAVQFMNKNLSEMVDSHCRRFGIAI
jgi:hypothetical protein